MRCIARGDVESLPVRLESPVMVSLRPLGNSKNTEYAGLDGVEQERQCGLKIDRVQLPADQRARI
jgi:hypothetical protein